MSSVADIAWTIADDGTSSLDSVMLVAEPVKGVIPDGVRLEVRAFTSSEVRNREVVEQREASVWHVNENGARAAQDASVRFGRAGTAAAGGFSASCEENTRYWRDGVELEAGELYWWPRQTYVKRTDGFWVDLPDGALATFRDVMASAAEYVGTHCPHLWAGGEVASAARALASADADLVKAREAVKVAKARLVKAERAHGRALPA